MPRLTSYKVIFLLVCIPFFLLGCGEKNNQLKSGDLIQLGFNQSNVKAVYIEETENTLTVSLGNDISGPPKVFNKDDIRYIEKRTKPVKLTAKTYKPSIKETVKPITKPAIVSSQEQSLKTSNNEIGLKKIYEAQGFNSYIASSIMGVVREGELFDFKVTVGGDLSDKRKVNLKYDGPELEIIDSSFTKSVINQEVVSIFEYEISAKAGNYDIYGVIDDGLETHKIAIKIFPKKKPSPEKFNSDKLENDYKVNLAKASEGDPEAQYRISFALLNGKGVIKNRSEGISWLRKSALSGFAEAQFALGGFYQNGVNGIEVDKLKATELYMKSANQGHPFAQFIVGVFFMNGENGFEVNKQIIQLSEVLNELKQIRILSIKADYYEMNKCVDFCFDKIKDWAEESTQWDHLQVQFLYMTVNMSKCLINPNHNCHEEKFAIASTKFNEPPVTQSLATEGLDLLDRSLKMIYMCLSMNNSSMSQEKLHDMETYLKSELLHILKRKNSLKQHLHTSN